tara:strand:+ start:198 stop:449 length:252 start_codon:yes stop_codon:yes gene_type:complete
VKALVALRRVSKVKRAHRSDVINVPSPGAVVFVIAAVIAPGHVVCELGLNVTLEFLYGAAQQGLNVGSALMHMQIKVFVPWCI